MKILILSFYYKPDLCAGSFRTQAFVNSLKSKIKSDDVVEIYTTIPNRYNSFAKKAPFYEEIENIIIHRIELPKHQSGFIDQAKAFSKYYFTVLKMIRHKKYDKIFATSSRLFTAFIGARIAKRTKTILYLDIRDIFYDTIKSVFKGRLINYIFPFFMIRWIERYTFHSANHINLVSEGFKEYFSQFKDTSELSFFTNGIDNEFLNFTYQTNQKNDKKQKYITYAGNIGEGQGIDWIAPRLAEKLPENYILRIIGDGGMKQELIKKLTNENIANIELLPPVDRNKLIEFYQETDFFFLSLNNYPAFLKVLPSKIFEYGAIGKPGIAVLSGYSKTFIEKWLPNWLVLDFKDLDEEPDFFAQCISDLSISQNEKFIAVYKRETIMNKIAENFLSFDKY